MHPKSHMANLHDEFWHKCINAQPSREGKTRVMRQWQHNIFTHKKNQGSAIQIFQIPATIVRTQKWHSHES